MSPAERTSRLVAVLIDFACALVPLSFLFIGMWPVLAGGALMMRGLSKSSVDQVMGGALGTVGMICVGVGLVVGALLTLWQWFLLSTGGVTIGKSMVGIRVVTVSGDRAGFGRALALRVWVFGLICSLPYIGWLVAVLDVVPLFFPDRRCLHDYLAGTRVMRFKPRAAWEAAVAMGFALIGFGVVGAGAWSVAHLVTGDADAQEAIRRAHEIVDGTLPPEPSAPSRIEISVADAGTIVVASSAPPPPSAAPVSADDARQIYVFTDEHGVPHIVQSLKNVPEKYRATAERK